MTAFSLVSAGATRSLRCPYCDRAMPRDERGMFAAQAGWGFCGASATEKGRVIGLLLISAPSQLGGENARSALVNSAWVDPEAVGRGIGRHLVQSLSAGLAAVRIETVLANAGTQLGCAGVPSGFLRSTGFSATNRPGIWRLDLAQTVQDKGAVRTALERLIDVVRPLSPPEPASRDRSN